MYRVMAILKNGISIIAAEAQNIDDAEKRLIEIQRLICDPTSARMVFRDGYRIVQAKEIDAAWIEECVNDE